MDLVACLPHRHGVSQTPLRRSGSHRGASGPSHQGTVTAELASLWHGEWSRSTGPAIFSSLPSSSRRRNRAPLNRHDEKASPPGRTRRSARWLIGAPSRGREEDDDADQDPREGRSPDPDPPQLKGAAVGARRPPRTLSPVARPSAWARRVSGGVTRRWSGPAPERASALRARDGGRRSGRGWR